MPREPGQRDQAYSWTATTQVDPSFRVAGTIDNPLRLPEMARDCWLEVVRCPHCGKMCEALISAEDFLLDFHVGSIPHGFKVIPSNELGSFIFCASCDMP